VAAVLALTTQHQGKILKLGVEEYPFSPTLTALSDTKHYLLDF
jgi:hypothetical protein